MSQLTCDYHPHRQANDKCHDCGRLICLEDKQIIQPTSGFNKLPGGIYCSTCYYNLAKSSNKPFFTTEMAGAISFIVLLFFGGFILLLSLLGSVSSFLIYFFVFFIAIAISMIWLAQFLSSKVTQSPLDLNRAFQLHKRLIDSANPKLTNNEFCMNCGVSISKSERICPNCGVDLQPAK